MGAEQLLALLAPAIRVEPALLRAVRYLLPAGEVDVGSEAAAWNHPKVQPTPLAFCYATEAIDEYRKAFRNQPKEWRGQSAELINRQHAGLSPAIGIEERLVFANLEDITDREAEQWLAGIVKTLRTRQGALTEAMAAWIERMTPRQQALIGQSEVLTAACVAVYLARRWRDKNEKVLPPSGVELPQFAWMKPPGNVIRRYVVRQRGQSLYLEGNVQPIPTGFDAPGSWVAEINAAIDFVQVQHLADEVPVGEIRIQRLYKNQLPEPGLKKA